MRSTWERENWLFEIFLKLRTHIFLYLCVYSFSFTAYSQTLIVFKFLWFGDIVCGCGVDAFVASIHLYNIFFYYYRPQATCVT